jgi:hypothetical protein
MTDVDRIERPAEDPEPFPARHRRRLQTDRTASPRERAGSVRSCTTAP